MSSAKQGQKQTTAKEPIKCIDCQTNTSKRDTLGERRGLINSYSRRMTIRATGLIEMNSALPGNEDKERIANAQLLERC